MLITAAWGQGEGIVSGACNTDEFVWRKGEGELSATIADKDLIVCKGKDGGTEERELIGEQRKLRCIDEETLGYLCQKSEMLERSFGIPLDIEWAVVDAVWFLQARPIQPCRPPNTSGPVVVWDNSNIQEAIAGDFR